MSAKMIVCKACGKEIAANAKVCPNCGQKNKKPFYKKAWFWIIVVVVAIAIGAGGGATGSGGTSNPSSGENSSGVTATMGQKNALRSAKNYLSVMAFSHDGLIKQLEFEGYTTEDATYAADNCGANWNEQAAKKAKEYLNTMAFSKDGLIKQLLFEGFTQEQAEYGVAQNGY